MTSDIFENVCFTIVKHYFLRFGRVSNLDHFATRFVHSFWTSFFPCVCGYYAIWGAKGLPKGSPGETLKSQIRVKFQSLVPMRSQGGFQGAKLEILEVILECFGGLFWWVFDEVYVQVPVTVTSMSQHVLLEFHNCFMQEFSLAIACQSTFATLVILSRRRCMCLGLS